MYIIEILMERSRFFLTHLMTKFKIHEIIAKNLVINFDISTLKLGKFQKSIIAYGKFECYSLFIKLLFMTTFNITSYNCYRDGIIVGWRQHVGMATASSSGRRHCRTGAKRE